MKLPKSRIPSESEGEGTLHLREPAPEPKSRSFPSIAHKGGAREWHVAVAGVPFPANFAKIGTPRLARGYRHSPSIELSYQKEKKEGGK